MSAPPSRSQRRPLHERSQSQTNTLAIRVVPYTPPRLDGLQSHHAAPSRRAAVDPGGQSEQDSSTDQARKNPSSYLGYYASNPGLALQSSSSSSTPLVLFEDDGVSGSKLVSDPSESGGGPGTPTTPVAYPPFTPTAISRVNATSQPAHEQNDQSATAVSQRPLSRRRNLVAVHSDKTFSLLPHADHGGFRSPSLSFSTSSSHERVSSDAFSDDRPSSPLTTAPERSVSPYTPGSSSTQLAEDHIGFSSSPWNYRMVGGLRKVPKTPDFKQKSTIIPTSSSDLRLAPLPEAPSTEPNSHSLLTKTSFQSSQTTSTTSETTNYKLYGSSSPVVPDTYSLAPSSSHSNYHLLGESSPAASVDQHRPKTADSNENYVLHGDPSPAGSLVTVKHRVRPEYSQESLVVPPLRPAKKRSHERIGYYKTRSRESLRAGSLTSISSVLTQEATQALFATPASIYLHGAPVPNWRQDSWAGSSNLVPSKPHMLAHPHQWSSQLSTVASESEGGSSLGSRSISPSSAPGRRSSGFPSNHSRQMLSISSSLAGQEERSHSRSHSYSDSLDRPQPAYTRAPNRDPAASAVRLVRDQDEHGDGLTDLHELQQRPSRSRLSSFFSGASSDRNLHSSASSRANSFGSSSLPAWARFYYGSGERKFLAASSESMISEFNDSRPASSFRSGSPSTEHLPLSIYSPRRRVREVNANVARPASNTGSMDINQVAPLHGFHPRFGLRKQTSSIWSPHLRHDRRASRYSIWEPPSVNWSAESGWLGRRNIQVVLFLLGFIFPFAWMIAAFLPLPPNPQQEMSERDHSTSLLDFRRDLHRRMRVVDETNYNSARWWRQLNRYMSVVGLLVLGAVVALVVVGIRQGWGQNGP